MKKYFPWVNKWARLGRNIFIIHAIKWIDNKPPGIPEIPFGIQKRQVKAQMGVERAKCTICPCVPGKTDVPLQHCGGTLPRATVHPILKWRPRAGRLILKNEKGSFYHNPEAVEAKRGRIEERENSFGKRKRGEDNIDMFIKTETAKLG